MSKERTLKPRYFDKRFFFESYGVVVEIAADDDDMLAEAGKTVIKAFGSNATIFERESLEPNTTFGITHEGETFSLFKNGFEISAGPSKRNFFKYLNSALRLEIAEFAMDRIFVHAGVVGWKGHAIIIPGTSFSGKSTLTAELVKAGAEYYSDEYAVLGADGAVSPFPRHISMRYFGATREKDVPVEDLGGKQGTVAIPAGMVLFTEFSRSAKWEPEVLTAGKGIMELIPNTLSMRRDPAFSLKVLDLVAQRAIIVKSPRGDAKKFAKLLLDFFEKNYKLTKMT